MIIYSWNINGFNTCNKYGGLSTILDKNPDILCLQEVKVSDPNALLNLFTLNYEHYYNFSNNKGKNGVYVFSKRKAKRCIDQIGFNRFDNDGRLLLLEYENFSLLNIYMPHGGRDKKNLDYKLESYCYLFEFLRSYKDKNIIMVGDFNIAHSILDLERYKNNYNNIMFTQQERQLLTQLTELGFSDVFRYLNPKVKEYTWWPYAFDARIRNIGWRIDYCFVSNKILDCVSRLKIEKQIFGSDHCPIRIDIDI